MSLVFTFYFSDDDEFVRRREKRLNDIEELKTREQTLNSSRRVSEHLVDQLKSAVIQYRNEIAAIRSEESRYNREIGIIIFFHRLSIVIEYVYLRCSFICILKILNGEC